MCGLWNQLFDVDNHVNRHAVDYIFSTEGHLFPVSTLFRRAAGPRRTDVKHSRRKNIETTETTETKVVFTLPRLYNISSNVSRSVLFSASNSIAGNGNIVRMLFDSLYSWAY